MDPDLFLDAVLAAGTFPTGLMHAQFLTGSAITAMEVVPHKQIHRNIPNVSEQIRR